jgi:hypothetical protein
MNSEVYTINVEVKLPSACSFVLCTKPTDNKERQESKYAHKNQETNENTTTATKKKHK